MTLSHYACVYSLVLCLWHIILPSWDVSYLALWLIFTSLCFRPFIHLARPPSIPHVMLGDLRGPLVDHDLHLWPSLLAFDGIVAHFEDGVEYYIHLFIAWNIFFCSFHGWRGVFYSWWTFFSLRGGLFYHFWRHSSSYVGRGGLFDLFLELLYHLWHFLPLFYDVTEKIHCICSWY